MTVNAGSFTGIGNRTIDNDLILNGGTFRADGNGNTTTFRTDSWRFTRRNCSVSGAIYDDRNNNGQRDAMESGIAGVEVELFDALRGTVVATQTTGSAGTYSLVGATQGFHQVRLSPASLPAGSDATEDPDGTESCGLASYLFACDETEIDQDFGFDVPDNLGTRYCSPAAPNSTGQPASMELVGSAVIASNELMLIANQVPPNEIGMFVTSRNVGSTPMGAGTLCVSAPFGRLGGPQFSGAQGILMTKLNLTDRWPVPNIAAPMAGETWHFTAWFRDGAGVFNFSDAMSVTFQ